MNIEVKKFDFSNVDIVSQKQASEHYKIYVEMVNKANETMNVLNKTDLGQPNDVYSTVRNAKIAEGYAYNAVKLHEYFFENLTQSNTPCTGKILEVINKDFGSYANFEKKFKDVAQSVTGYATLAYDNVTKKLCIGGADSYDQAAVDEVPLAVVDLYEHGYFLDYGADKAKYINNTMSSINWQVVNNRLDKVLATNAVMA